MNPPAPEPGGARSHRWRTPIGDFGLLGETEGLLARTPVGAATLRPLHVAVTATDLSIDGSVLAAVLTVDPGGARVRYATADAPDMTVAAPYAALLGWLHDPPTLLGHLMHHGHRVDGSLAALSAVEGVVSSAPVGAAPSPADRAAWVAEMSSSPDEGLASGVTTVAVTVVTLEEGEGEDVLA